VGRAPAEARVRRAGKGLPAAKAPKAAVQKVARATGRGRVEPPLARSPLGQELELGITQQTLTRGEVVARTNLIRVLLLQDGWQGMALV
jgi:hypothetical protein